MKIGRFSNEYLEVRSGCLFLEQMSVINNSVIVIIVQPLVGAYKATFEAVQGSGCGRDRDRGKKADSGVLYREGSRSV